jgi:plasmid stabilization system protein ParE
MKNIRWLLEAKDDLQRLNDFLSPHSPAAAKQAILAIATGVQNLAQFPESGRPWELDRTYREWDIRFGANGYVVRYRVIEDEIVITRVWHSLEQRER